MEGGEDPKREEDALATDAAVRESRLVKMPLVLILVGGEDARGGDATREGWGSFRPPSGG